MARTQLFLLAALVVIVLPLEGIAGEVFTGVQIDNKSEYFTYLGVRTPITSTSGKSGFQPFVQLFGASLGYTFKVNGEERDARADFLVPSLGLKKTLGAWSLVGFAGPQLRRKQEDLQGGGKGRIDDIGAYVQGEAFYWQERGNFHAIGSYTDLDRFYWGRLRGKLLAYKSDKWCCTTYVGWDVTGMGNKDFHAELTGPLAEVQVSRFSFLVRGGYQYTQTFRSGAYTGFEIYFPF